MFTTLINSIIQQIDPRIVELQKDLEFYQTVVIGLSIVIGLLFLIVILQRLSIRLMKQGRQGKSPGRLPKIRKSAEKKTLPSATPAAGSSPVMPKELPDPGLIFKYSLAAENTTEKTITIGQKNGNIKTYSTEILDDHLNLYIRIIENRRDQDIYNLPDHIAEEYQIDFRRDSKVLIYYPGLQGYREMGARERVYIKADPDETGDPTFPALDAKNPIRFRLGDRLDQDGKFTGGYFEFHLFTKDYEVKTKSNIAKTEKNFLLRLYKIYPGYDTGAPTEDGLYPMIDPFATQ